MGANSIRSFTIGFALCAITIVYFVPSTRDSVLSVFPMIGIPEKTVLDFIDKLYDKITNIGQNSVDDKPKVVKERILSKEELAKYDGGPNSLGLYLAILGNVFDVEKGAQHYKPGGGYDFFAGRDASRSYITGVLEKNVEPDDLTGLDDTAYASLEDWLSFYKDEYPYIGKVTGRFYDDSGNPTAELENVHKRFKEIATNKWLEQNEKQIFPPCNSEWSKEKGNRVWCTNKSGGVDRNWIGVPRQFFKAGKDPRCVCVRDSGPPSNLKTSEKHNNKGDLENPNLQVYPNCPETESSCKVDHP